MVGLLADLGAVLVVLQAALGLEVTVHLGLDDTRRDGDLDCLEQLLEQPVAGLDGLVEVLTPAACVAQVVA